MAVVDSTKSPRVLEVTNLNKVFWSKTGNTEAVGDVTFDVARGEFVCIVGPSGGGKTTLLRCIAGLQSLTGGTVVLDGQRVTSPPETLAIVFQDYRASLLPWLTVRKNILLPLRHKRLDRKTRDRLVLESVESVGLTDFLDFYPWQLSGGMQQRIAIARALAYEPEILLMDEPFASVDAQTRADLEDLVLDIRRRSGMTILLVTHDVDEAVYLADRVVVLSRRPSRVIDEVLVDLPGDRDQINTKELPEFAHLRARVFRAVREQVADSHSSAPQ